MNNHPFETDFEVRYAGPDAAHSVGSTDDDRVTAEAPRAGDVVSIVEALEALAAYADFQRHSAA